MYYLNVLYHAKDGKREAFLEQIKVLGIDAACRAEDGCLQYDYFFADGDPNLLLLVEQWETPAHQQAHTRQPHTAQLQALKAEYVETTELIAFEKA